MKDIRLTDGSLLEVKMNFLTMKLLQQANFTELEKKVEETGDESAGFEMTSKLIYALLRSNGRKVDEEEALMLVPADDEVITELIEQFTEEAEKLKKKQANKMKVPK